MAFSWPLTRECYNWSPLLLIVFWLLIPSKSMGQQPAGVNGTMLWYVSTKNTPTKWTDTSGHRYKDIFGSSLGKNRNINFHDAAYFPGPNGTKPYFAQTLEKFNFSQGTLVGIFYPAQNTNWQSAPYFLTLEDPQQRYEIYVNSINGIDAKDKEKEYNFGDARTRTTFEIDDKFTTVNNAMKTGVFYAANSQLSHSKWGDEKSLTLSSKFKGYIPELFIYTRVLSRVEILRVQSYLAIKYGITLDTSYLNSNGTTIWNFKDPAVKPFHNRVCAIANDPSAALIQPKSNTSYEEEYSSFQNDAAFNEDHLDPNNNMTIPRLDSPSLYRSLTIGFSNPINVPRGTYLLWGDNNVSIPQKPFSDLDAANKIEVINRIWMLKNPSKAQAPINLVLAGQSYDNSPNTLFEKAYEPFDYQFYRYLLVILNSPNVKDTSRLILNSYFGREQRSHVNATSFETRFLAWENQAFHGTEQTSYFTFGRVPLLSWWEVVKKRGAQAKKIPLLYPYDRNLPLFPETHFDTTVYDFKATDSLQLKLSLGAAPITIRIKEDRPGAVWSNIKDTASFASLEAVQAEPAPTTLQIPPTDSGGEHSAELGTGNKRYLQRQPWKKDLPSEYVKLPKLKTNTSYIVEATDRLGQKSNLLLRLTTALPPHQ